jgi:hypothetical protein
MKPRRTGRSTEHDHFQTPSHALAPLLRFLPKGKKIWEPACGNGNLVKALKKASHKVVGTDIKTGTDFLAYQRTPLSGDPDYPDAARPAPLGDVIITNPPYSLKTQFFSCAYSLGLPFAFLLPLDALGSSGRYKLFKKHGIQLLLLHKRVKYEFPPEWAETHKGKASSPDFDSCWLCWELLPEPIMFSSPRDW